MTEKKPKAPRVGECPQCHKRKALLNRNSPHPYMGPHTWKPPQGGRVPCPGTGRQPVKGTAR